MLLYAVMRSADGTADLALMAFVTCDLIDYISYDTTTTLIVSISRYLTSRTLLTTKL